MSVLSARTVARQAPEVLGGELAGFFEALAQKNLRGFIVEKKRALSVDDKNRRGQAIGQVPHKDQLEFFVRRGLWRELFFWRRSAASRGAFRLATGRHGCCVSVMPYFICPFNSCGQSSNHGSVQPICFVNKAEKGMILISLLPAM